VLAGQEIGCAVLIGHRVDGLAAGRHAGLLHEGHDPAVEVRHLVDWLAGLHVQTENFNVGPGAIIVVDDTATTGSNKKKEFIKRNNNGRKGFSKMGTRYNFFYRSWWCKII